jgi:hypothetical protein
MACVYCAEEAEAEEPADASLPLACRLSPKWVAYAAHDYFGDDLRRRWDDPEVVKISDADGGNHPVIFAGAGSHASYFSPGDYLTELELPFLAPVARVVQRVHSWWAGVLHQAGFGGVSSKLNIMRIPFVDYARGDGLKIGADQGRGWEACLIDDTTAWAAEYRGLWGLFARDPIAGENAPAGPIYNRDGSVRQPWYDPLGWAGLDKVPPPKEAMGILSRQRQKIEAHCAELEQEIAALSTDLQGLGLQGAALRGIAHLEDEHGENAREITALARKLARLREELTVEAAKLKAFDQYELRLLEGDQGPPRVHIRRAQQPYSEVDLRMGRLAEGFAAVSSGLLLIGIVGLIVFARHYLVFGLAAMIGLLIFLEAGFRRQLSQLISSLVIGLAVVSAFILLFKFFWQIVVVWVLAAGLYIMWENVRELRS